MIDRRATPSDDANPVVDREPPPGAGESDATSLAQAEAEVGYGDDAGDDAGRAEHPGETAVLLHRLSGERVGTLVT